MRVITCLALIAVAAMVGCTQVDENPKWAPQAQMPSWTYDAPFYYRPSEDLPVAETLSGLPVYYTNETSVFIRHPDNTQLNGVPRMGVWYSNDDGNSWNRAGFFGVEQTHFLFEAPGDARYWIRFAGPGQNVSDTRAPDSPNRIYVVDRKGPTIELSVVPPAWDDEEKKVPHIYKIGQTITLYWGVQDTNLAPGTIRLGTGFAKFPYTLNWSRFPNALSDSDSMRVEIPAEAAKQGGIRFRLEAVDKAGNIGIGMTDVLRVEGAAMPASRPGQTDPSMERTDTEQTKPGWPVHGDTLQAGSSRELGWLPKAASNYDALELQFSANNGLAWQPVATGLKAGQPTRWTVPQVASGDCRLRIAAMSKTKQTNQPLQVPLAVSQRFSVAGGATSQPAK
ncbi:MAG: hypothetical protein WC869_12060 [Phycisphaerae bacterium]|jgi:hypothetical protein